MYNVTDAVGNQAVEQVITITAVDNTAPVIIVADESVNKETAWESSATVFDNKDGDLIDSLEITYFMADGVTELADLASVNEQLASGHNVVVKYNAEDVEGNKAKEQVITLTAIDNTIPIITLVGDEAVYVEYGHTYTEEGATFTDNYDPSGNAIIGGDTVNNTVLKTYYITYNVTDSSGNKAIEVIRTVVVRDTTPPVFDDIADQTIEAGHSDIDWRYLIQNVQDNAMQGTTSQELIDNVKYKTPGTYTVTVQVTDASFNTTQKTFNVTVEDKVAPVIDPIPNQEIESGTTEIDWESYIRNLQENSDGTNQVDVTENINYRIPGIYPVTITVTDSSNNVVSKTFNVTVLDTIAPEFDEIENQVIEAGSNSPDWHDYVKNIVENSDHDTTITVTESIDYNVPGNYPVIIELKDAAGNVTTRRFSVHVNDTIAPTFDFIVDQTIEGGKINFDWTTLIKNQSDNSSSELRSLEVTDSIDYNTKGTYPVTVKLVDASGNETSETFNVTVVDVTPPTYNEIEDITIKVGLSDIDWRYLIENVLDNCDDGSRNYEVSDNVNYDRAGTYTVTVKVVDDALNETVTTFNVTVEDEIEYFLPYFITTGVLILITILSILFGMPLALWVSHTLRGKELAWLTRKDIKPAYTEVTLIWLLFFIVRFIIEIRLYINNNAYDLALFNIVIGLPLALLVLAVTCLYGIWRLHTLKGPSIEDFRNN